MWRKFLSFFRNDAAKSLGNDFNKLAPFITHLEQNFSKDKNAKNALIDTAIQILQQHKDLS